MARPRLNLLLILPPLVFFVFAAAAYVALRRDNPDELPSALVGQPVPAVTELVALRDDPAPTAADLSAPGVKLVNFFASWCAPCRAEHPVLAGLAAEGVPVIGINYKDDPAKARAFLAEMGDPYVRIGADETGRAGLDWGIYGVPETFVVDGAGKIVMRYPGPLDPTSIERRLRPAMAKAAGDG